MLEETLKESEEILHLYKKQTNKTLTKQSKKIDQNFPILPVATVAIRKPSYTERWISKQVSIQKFMSCIRMWENEENRDKSSSSPLKI